VHSLQALAPRVAKFVSAARVSTLDSCLRQASPTHSKSEAIGKVNTLLLVFCRMTPTRIRLTPCLQVQSFPHGGGGQRPNKPCGTMTSADFCPASHILPDAIATSEWHKGRSPGISPYSFAPLLPDLHKAGLGNHGFHCLLPAHPPLHALYLVSVRQVVAVAPASSRPHLTATPLPSLNGADSLARRGLAPPSVRTCPAYKK